MSFSWGRTIGTVITTGLVRTGGFSADVDSLAEEVTSEVEAVQFTITDIGSKWVSTGVVHTVTHKGKTEKIKSKIGIKLSKKLAQKKGLSIYGKEDREARRRLRKKNKKD